MKKLFLLLGCMALVVSGCSRKTTKIPDEKLEGIWQLDGASTLNGIQVCIRKENGVLTGRIFKLNENKLVRLFADSGDVLVSEISRRSNYEFKLTEKKLAGELFSMYGQKTSQDFNVEFIDENTLGLAQENSDPLKSTRIYKRIR